MKKYYLVLYLFICINNLAFATSHSYNIDAHAALSTGTYIEEIEPLSFGTIALPSTTSSIPNNSCVLYSIRPNGNIEDNSVGATISGYHRGKFRIYSTAGTIFTRGIVTTSNESISAGGNGYFRIPLYFDEEVNNIQIPSSGYKEIVFGGGLLLGNQFRTSEGSCNPWKITWGDVPKNQTHSYNQYNNR